MTCCRFWATLATSFGIVFGLERRVLKNKAEQKNKAEHKAFSTLIAILNGFGIFTKIGTSFSKLNSNLQSIFNTKTLYHDNIPFYNKKYLNFNTIIQLIGHEYIFDNLFGIKSYHQYLNCICLIKSESSIEKQIPYILKLYELVNLQKNTKSKSDDYKFYYLISNYYWKTGKIRI